MNQWIITSSVLIAIIAVLRFILRGKISLKLQYALWGLVLIRLLLPFSLFESPASVLNLMNEREKTEEVPVYYEPYAPGTINPAVPDDDIYILDDYVEQIAPDTDITLDDNGYVTEPEIRVISAKDILIPVWIGGIFLFGTVFAVSNFRFGKKLKESREFISGTKTWLPVYESSEIKTPCLFGMIKPAIYVKKEVLNDEKTMRHVIEHETTHYLHGDHIWSVLRCLCLALHWYNPFVWLAAFLSMRDSELACDEDTIKRIGEEERIEYGRTLINLTCEKPAVGILSAATTMTGSKSSIKERILLIAKKPKMLWITAVFVAVISLFAVGCTFTGAVNYNPKTTENPVLEDYSNMIFSDYSDTGKTVSMKVTAASEKEITTEVFNGTQKNVVYSVGYKLHFEQDGKWYELPVLDEETSDMRMAGVALKVTPEAGTSPFTNDIKESYGKLPDGKYRILRTFEYMGISENPDAESFVLAAEFVLKDGKLAFEYPSELEKTEYIPTEQIYLNPLSSFFGIPDERYRITDGTFVIQETETNAKIDTIEVSEWKWQDFPYSEEEWKELFVAGIDFPDISRYQSRYYQPIEEGKFIASMDGELWLVDIDPVKPASEEYMVWSIYRIVPKTLGEIKGEKVYWECAPAMSSRSPWFEFELDFDFSKVSAGTGDGNLVDVDKPGFASDYKVDITESSMIQWLPYSGEGIGGVEKAEINFAVYIDGENSEPLWGKIVIEEIERENLNVIYGATLVSDDFYLMQNKEFGGGIISLISENEAGENLKIPGTGIAFSDGVLTAKYSGIADFSNLDTVENPDEAEKLEIYLNSGEELFVPEFKNVKNLYIEITGSIKTLDISALKNLEQFTLLGKAEELILPENLESVSVYGQTDLSLFADCESIRNIEILGLTDLASLKNFSNLENITVGASGCDLSVLNEVNFSKLTLSNVGEDELSAINGCPINTLQISDEDISDLSFIKRLPNLEVIFLTVASGGNPYVTTFMEPTDEDLDNLATAADVSVLKEFIKNGGTLYLLTDPNREAKTNSANASAASYGLPESFGTDWSIPKNQLRNPDYNPILNVETEQGRTLIFWIDRPEDFVEGTAAQPSDKTATYKLTVLAENKNELGTYDTGIPLQRKYGGLNGDCAVPDITGSDGVWVSYKIALLSGGMNVRTGELGESNIQIGGVYAAMGENEKYGAVATDGKIFTEAEYDFYEYYDVNIIFGKRLSDGTEERDVFSSETFKMLKGSKAAEVLREYDSEKKAGLKNAKIGDTVTFGSYHGSSKWKVLDKKDGKILLISEKCLDAMPYNTEREDVTWENSTIRAWLNGEFAEKAFSAEEFSAIASTKLDNPKNTRFGGAKGGNATTDKVFLLSYDEANEYFPAEAEEKTGMTGYARSKEIWYYTFRVEEGPCWWWWLRSPGLGQDMASIFYCNENFFGGAANDGLTVETICAVRPAIWVDISKIQ